MVIRILSASVLSAGWAKRQPQPSENVLQRHDTRTERLTIVEDDLGRQVERGSVSHLRSPFVSTHVTQCQAIRDLLTPMFRS
jgi:hypothetical protein